MPCGTCAGSSLGSSLIAQSVVNSNPATPAAFSLFLAGELAKYQRLVKSLNIKSE